MIVLPSGAPVWLACGYTDMRKGMDGLAMLAQQVLAENPFICVGDNYVAALRRGWISAPRAGLAAT
jgi:transposase